jgi:SAM-dependent methyltransferase
LTPAANLRAGEVLKRLPLGEVVGVEVGVFRGYMSHALLENPNLTLYMVDNWVGNEKFAHIGHGKASQPENKRLAVANTAFATGRRFIFHGESVEMAKEVPNDLDFVFIDADHSYKGVRDDIEAWKDKVKPGGLLSGHDYNNPNDPCGPEVKRAVDEAARKYGWEVTIGRNTTWFVRL